MLFSAHQLELSVLKKLKGLAELPFWQIVEWLILHHSYPSMHMVHVIILCIRQSHTSD